MAEALIVWVFWLAVVFLGAFVILGLASKTMRRRLQVPAERMLEADRRRWGPPAVKKKTEKKTEKKAETKVEKEGET